MYCLLYLMSRLAIHKDQSKVSNVLFAVSHVETVDTRDQSMSCFNGSNTVDTVNTVNTVVFTAFKQMYTDTVSNIILSLICLL